MNKREKEVLEASLRNEEAVLKKLKTTYRTALKDINAKIRILQTDEMTQSKIYQLNYQKALKGQISTILEKMNDDQYESIQDYLKQCYEDGYIGTFYNLQGQGIPLVIPINQDQVVKALVNDVPLSTNMYTHMGKSVKVLKNRINAEISRGLSQGYTYDQIARNVEKRATIGYSNAARIARTEGHRVQNQSTMDAMKKAKDAGADIVKQWDSTMDKKTRPDHVKLDGQIREIDEPFEVNGHKAMYPSGFGVAKEDINCRCTMLQRARWAIGDEDITKMDNESKNIVPIKEKNFEKFKGKFLTASAKIAEELGDVFEQPVNSTDEYYNTLIKGANDAGVTYKPVQMYDFVPSEDAIIETLAGGDYTQGSCASLGLAFIGQKQGWNVLDFRDGTSRRFFSSALNLGQVSQMDGMKVLHGTGASDLTVGNKLLKQCEVGKEYYLCVGRHASIVRKLDDGTIQYLELQSANNSGWHNFSERPRETLAWRFGCSSRSNRWSEKLSFMIDINDSTFGDEFKSLLGYINTAVDAQKKGIGGTIK